MSLTKLSLGGIQLFSAMESVVSEIQAGNGKTANLFFQCMWNQILLIKGPRVWDSFNTVSTLVLSDVLSWLKKTPTIFLSLLSYKNKSSPQWGLSIIPFPATGYRKRVVLSPHRNSGLINEKYVIGVQVCSYIFYYDPLGSFLSPCHTATGIPIIYSFSGNSAASAPIFTFMCLCPIYIFPGSVHIFPPAEKADPSWKYTIRSQTHQCGNCDWGPRYSFYRNICFKFSAFCLCSA
jgi:hypothetical protein